MKFFLIWIRSRIIDELNFCEINELEFSFSKGNEFEFSFFKVNEFKFEFKLKN